MASFVLLPAVDITAGRAVRPGRGEADTLPLTGDPVQVALSWQAAGAQWVHLVDLDAAFGRGSNAELLADVVQTLDVPVQVSGGVCDEASLHRALATGCARVNLGTDALADLEWCAAVIAEHGDRVTVGLDVCGSTLTARGSGREAGELFETLAVLEWAGCARYVVTDVARDGALAGPNLPLLREVCAATGRPVIASGGVASLGDLRALAGLAPLGLEGAIVGKALYEGRFTVKEAIAACGP